MCSKMKPSQFLFSQSPTGRPDPTRTDLNCSVLTEYLSNLEYYSNGKIASYPRLKVKWSSILVSMNLFV